MFLKEKGAYYNVSMNNQTVKTPCVGICKYNKQNFCVGCKRKSNEISGWINYSDKMRRAIMQDLKNRKIDSPDAFTQI